MAALEFESEVDNEQPLLPKPQRDLTNNDRYRSLYEAVSESELGSTVPSHVIHVISEFGHNIIDSTLLSAEEQEYMVEMIGSQQQTEKFKYNDWKLLCRASDGDGTQKQFHKACDGKKHTVCLLEVEETGYICGGYASAEWRSTGNSPGQEDDEAFLFVIRPMEKRNVFHRKLDDDGKIYRDMRPQLGSNKHQGFNLGYHTLYWGSKYAKGRDNKVIYIENEHYEGQKKYFDYEFERDVVGEQGWDSTHWKDWEVFQLDASAIDEVSSVNNCCNIC